jgi:tRNA-splicing ligase RtcB
MGKILKIAGTHDESTIKQIERCVAVEEEALGVVSADGHKGYSMPIGGVVGYRGLISPSGVGYDIACGNMAVETPLLANDIKGAEWEKLADEIERRISFGIGRKNNEPVDHQVFDAINTSSIPQQRNLIDKAKAQLGTVGSGNHYVDLLIDQSSGRVWVAVHFGSRGFGHTTANGFMAIAQGKKFEDGKGEGEMDAPPLVLGIDTPSGQDYIEAMHIAGQYAYAGRETVVAKVLEILQTKPIFSVHNHHNFAWKECHNGEDFWVVRKGATPAFPGQLGFVGGSMGDISVILKGVESEASKNMLYSTVHGAGRVMSRTQAAGKQKWVKSRWACGNYRNCTFEAPAADYQQGEQNLCPKCGNKLHYRKAHMFRLSDGAVDFVGEKQKLVEKGVILRGAGPDEAPPVYRPLQSVLDAHAGTIEVIHTLFPKVVVMAGKDEYDPYKD